jgi:hypothetical protein
MEMAQAVGDNASSREYERLYANGSRWIDQNLFNGQYYIQKVVGRPADQIASGLRMGLDHPGESGGEDTENPEYQMGEACLCDQLVGQYMAHVVGLAYLLDREHVRTTVRSVYRNNYKPSFGEQENVQRTYALNDDAGVVVATYPNGNRPEIPFPYFAETWNGLEYQLAAHLVYEGMTAEALTIVQSVRRRHDGEKRNPWNEAECGHHYARPMASWALVVALSGFHYSGVERKLTLSPRVAESKVRSFWTAPSGWGTFEHSQVAASLDAQVDVEEGSLTLKSLVLSGIAREPMKGLSLKLGDETVNGKLQQDGGRRVIVFEREIRISCNLPLTVAMKV